MVARYALIHLDRSDNRLLTLPSIHKRSADGAGH